jgi:hypothetical protein
MTATDERLAEPANDPVFIACTELIGRTGAASFQIRYSDDPEPVVWIAVASFDRDSGQVHETAAGMDPRTAAYRLCETVLDGGQCRHCARPCGVSEPARCPPSRRSAGTATTPSCTPSAAPVKAASHEPPPRAHGPHHHRLGRGRERPNPPPA